MKRFFLSVALCTSLLLVGLFFFLPSTGAQEQQNPLQGLLNLPAPPPPNPFYTPVFSERDEDFYSKKNPPADDAPIDDLMDYWNRQNNQAGQLSYKAKLSEKALKRLLNEIEKKPERLTEFLNVLDESEEAAQFVKQLYDRENSARKFDPSWRSSVKRWLTYHSPYFSDELYNTARQAGDTKEYVTNQEEVLALARVDWEKAKPLLDRMLSDSTQPVSQTLARWAYYKHAVATNDSFGIDKYRRELQETVENKSLQPGNRDLAMDALVSEGDFAGRDEWYFSLLEDETLYELRVGGQVYTGLTTLINVSEPDKYLDRMVELAASGNPAVRNAAVRNLTTMLNNKNAAKIVRALLPWLENPRWAKQVGGERQRLVSALRTVAIPESVPGLIAMLNEKETSQQVTNSMSNLNAAAVNRAYNSANVSGNMTRTVDFYPFRSEAIAALEKQRSPQAASALRQVLGLVEPWERQTVVRAILASSGFSITEQIEAMEKVAKDVGKMEQTVESADLTNTVASSETDEEYELKAPEMRVMTTNTPGIANSQILRREIDFNDIRYLLGTQMVNLEDPSEQLIKAVIDRIAFYDKRDPEMAAGLRRIIQNWKGTAVNALLLRDLKDGKSNAAAILKLLVLRKELREKQPDDVADIRSGKPAALGISACLLEQPEDSDAILSNAADEAKTALLACARLIRAPLAVPKVAALLKSPNKTLALAAERYLEAEDSPEARAQVLAIHPNEAKVLGARLSFSTGSTPAAFNLYGMSRELFITVDPKFARFPPYYFYGMTANEDLENRLQKEVKENQELLGVYAYANNFVRIYREKVVFSWEDDPARYRERELSADEFEALKNFLAAQRVDELPPFLSPCDSCESKELLMLGRAGGRRVFVRADPLPQFFVELESIFEEFRRQPARIRYYLEKDLPGMEILYADDNLKAETLWKNGEDFRLLIDDQTQRRENERAAQELEENATEETEATESEESETEEGRPETAEQRKRRQQIERQSLFGSYAWYRFDKTKLVGAAAQPADVWFIPPVDGFAVQPTDKQWKARGTGVEIRADRDGLYKIARGQMTKIRDGDFYYNPVVTANGRWVIVSKYSDSEEEYGGATVRINLLTNKEYKIKTPEQDYGTPEPIAFLPALNKVVLFYSYGESEGGYDETERDGEFFLLDPETGVVSPVAGDAAPLLHQTFRPLQPLAGVADSVWTAIPDREKNATKFGVYNLRTLAFKPLLTIPKIAFNSMDTWVDEREGKIYFVYEGHLLALPLPKSR